MVVICQILYLISAVCFISGLKGLSDPRTARRGNLTSAVGMFIGIVTSLIYPLEGSTDNFLWIGGASLVGAAFGWWKAQKVAMTGMPQLVSLFNGLGGASAMLLAILEFLKSAYGSSVDLAKITVLFTLLIGAISFSGSILAYLKLDGKIQDKHVILPRHQTVNVILLLITLASIVYAYISPGTLTVLIATALSLIYGFSFVAPIGGADMPVVISLLNSVTGISAASAGYLYNNQIMILGGILVGASGTILTVLMCRAMNRSLANVLIGNFSGGGAASGSPAADTDQTVIETTAADVAILLNYASQVVLVPGYGMAVAQAQKQAKEMDDILTEKGVNVFYGIHPVAGRMPGHMNVLLAEVDISYDKLLDLDDCNKILSDTDIVLIVGANDVVNPSALEDPGSNVYGMPVLEVWKARQTIVFKRSMSPGYAGIQNPLFFKPNNKMLFGDAKKSLEEIIALLKTL